jgi:FMN-dependent NADH-azoreductase
LTTLLRIESSARIEGSHSRQLGDYFTDLWRQQHPEGDVVTRDLAQNPVPHISNQALEAFFQDLGDTRSETELSDKLINEIEQADHLLIESPLYNFSLPSTLKAYFDYITRSGKTFDPQEDGRLVGLLTGKCATVITSRGSLSTEGVQDDFRTPYIRTILGFLGISDVTTIAVEGTALSEGIRPEQIEGAQNSIVDRIAHQGKV